MTDPRYSLPPSLFEARHEAYELAETAAAVLLLIAVLAYRWWLA